LINRALCMHVYLSILPVNLNVSWKFRLSSLTLL